MSRCYRGSLQDKFQRLRLDSLPSPGNWGQPKPADAETCRHHSPRSISTANDSSAGDKLLQDGQEAQTPEKAPRCESRRITAFLKVRFEAPESCLTPQQAQSELSCAVFDAGRMCDWAWLQQRRACVGLDGLLSPNAHVGLIVDRWQKDFVIDNIEKRRGMIWPS